MKRRLLAMAALTAVLLLTGCGAPFYLEQERE